MKRTFCLSWHRLSAALLIIVALAGCSIDTPDQATDGTVEPSSELIAGMELHDNCPNLVGEWVSGEYEALSVSVDGAHTELAGLSMVLRISHQVGCHFVADNQWNNAEIGGREHGAGVLNPIGNWITILEGGEHPDGGTTGRVRGRLVDGDHINWEYAAYSSDGSHATVFSTILSRSGVPTQRETCPSLLGVWKSPEFEVLELHADGSTSRHSGTRATLEVAHQDQCHFRGVNTWSRGDRGGSEPVAGVLHRDGALITILEVGGVSEGGTQAYVRARLTGQDRMEWNYVGLSADASMGQAFGVSLSRGGEGAPRDSCPDLRGTWSSSHWEGLIVDSEGDHEVLSHEFKRLTIEEQFGCSLTGRLEYGSQGDESETQTERVIGEMSAEEGVVSMRVVAPHPEDGLTASLTLRVEDGQMISEYSGATASGSEVLVYLLDLARE